MLGEAKRGHKTLCQLEHECIRLRLDDSDVQRSVVCLLKEMQCGVRKINVGRTLITSVASKTRVCEIPDGSSTRLISESLRDYIDKLSDVGVARYRN